ncbi:thiamine-phosphate kinase [Sediminicurvatus halobius]|uniref:Thiamine-monophosphate kinase n=1 Tax=Sediminicurvatus halobius TaxID=2182432 RepID=A0A2U2MYY5_9GAMM|nr:thiamine-phosphate kinase [Spiribacter halobius]PWG62146.1 thiamine-phosphate kinase [Spiribacter halobius]UEX77168.1 thiamine-phosphate kinase [Spiribacter halobius]
MALSEFALIARYLVHVGAAREDVLLGVGDDAALVRPAPGRPQALALDTLVADVHFPADAAAADVGHKALAVNLSDLAAMGATPQWALLALTLPKVDEPWLEGFAAGFGALATAHGVALVGGDVTRGPLTVSVQVIGCLAGPALRRDGARPGDRVWLSGRPGEAAAGLAAWQSGAGEDRRWARLLRRLHRPTPRVALGQALAGVASAAIDVSDGVAADAGHIAAASGVGIELRADWLPLSRRLRAWAGDRAAVDLALNGGDDYELCFTAPAAADSALGSLAAAQSLPLTPIGRVTEGAGLRVRDARGRELAGGGYQHFGGGA